MSTVFRLANRFPIRPANFSLTGQSAITYEYDDAGRLIEDLILENLALRQQLLALHAHSHSSVIYMGIFDEETFHESLVADAMNSNS